MKAARFDYMRPRSVAETVAALEHNDDAVLLGGGQSLMPLLVGRRLRPSWVVDLNGLESSLGRVAIEQSDGGSGVIRIGALVRHSQLEHHEVVKEVLPVLSDAASCVGYPAVRNRGTVGGSVAFCHPAAELPAALAAVGATVMVRGSRGQREMPVASIARAPFSNTLAQDEVVVEVSVPLDMSGEKAGVPAGEHRTGSAWFEFSRGRSEFPLAGIAAVIWLDGNGRCVGARAVAGGVGPAPVDLTECLGDLVGNSWLGDRLAEALAKHVERRIDPPSDLSGSARDRSEVAGLLLRRALRAAWDRARAGASS